MSDRRHRKTQISQSKYIKKSVPFPITGRRVIGKGFISSREYARVTPRTRLSPFPTSMYVSWAYCEKRVSTDTNEAFQVVNDGEKE